MKRDAVISGCGTYRYRLTREWGDGLTVAFIMLNPSTADASVDDPTIRRCIGFAKAWGYAGLTVYNLFALRATDPEALYSHRDPIGPSNDEYLRNGTRGHTLIVAAWGTHGAYRGRGVVVRQMLPDLTHLGLTKGGHPRHPLYLPATAKPVQFAPPAIRGAAA